MEQANRAPATEDLAEQWTEEDLLMDYAQQPPPGKEALNLARGQRWLATVQALVATGQSEEAAQLAAVLRSPLQEALQLHAPEVEYLALYLEWIPIAASFQVFEPDSFAELEDFLPLLQLSDGATDADILVIGARARLSLLVSYYNWLALGGKAAALATHRQTLLQQLEQQYLPQLAQQPAQLRATGQLPQAAALQRLLANYYLARRQPNEALKLRKDLLQHLRHLPNFEPVQLAELNLEIGVLLAEYEKWQGALPYFTAATEILAGAGEEQEALALQVEAWLETCSLHLPKK